MTGLADLVVVSSPLQYVNAAEWRRRRAGGVADLVLLGDRAGGAAAIDALIARDPSLWRRIVRHPGRPQGAGPRMLRDAADLRHRRSLEALARELGERDAVAFGDFRNVSHRALVASVRHRELVLLDDGSVAPQVAAARRDPATAPAPERFQPGWFRTALARAAFGERAPPDPPSLTFFTVYGSLIGPTMLSGDRLERHAYEGWRSRSAAAPRGGDVWLLGSNHAEAGICSPDAYRALIVDGVAALRRAGHAGPVVYRPHRGERADRAQTLAREAGLTLGGGDGLPVEIAYLDAAVRPARVVVIASSAADTLSVIDPELPIARLALPDGYLRRQREHILAVVAGHDAFNPRLVVLKPAAASPWTNSIS
ncbi:hypothetical protein [Hansschlegelia sp. KR7-227]|uniref:hypothetical protein n=1 Tax=Hansschlegelia sp. KR7-227 TaxID=3400914 RepID=UPI003C0F982D